MEKMPGYEELRQRVEELEREREKRLAAERDSARRQGYLEAVLKNAPDAVVTLDSFHRVVEWNPAAERIFGYSQEEAQGRDIDEMITHPEETEEARNYTCRVLSGEPVDSAESVRYTKDNVPVQVLISGSPIIREGRLTGVVAIYTDISERKRMEQKLQDMASTDQLTGAFNRYKFLECLEHELKRCKRSRAPLCLLMLDIDHFKKVNDTWGHSIGDQVLQGLVQTIAKNLREVDILTRWGGEEFIVLTPDTDRQGGLAVAERLRKAVSEHVFPRVGSVTISLGLAQHEEKDTADSLISRADRQMYLAKEKGRNRVE
ncbi:MAG: diguanylate cyclase [Desulfohalobiaceae bacterium]|nr:diguanylate cyclase [Desulfohalobiaceae bacterium]